MKKLVLFAFVLIYMLNVKAQTNILVFSKTNGYRHASISNGQDMFKALAKQNNWKLTFSEDSLIINRKILCKTDVLVILNTTGNIYGADQKKALQKYVRKGGGVVAIHAATDTEIDWKWYVDMVGGAFKSHPQQQTATVNIVNRDFKAMQHFGETWLHFDEWYNFKDPVNPKAVVLAKVDESTYKGGEMGENHPVVWYQDYEGGKIFTTILGHTKESYVNADFVMMIKEAVIWANQN